MTSISPFKFKAIQPCVAVAAAVLLGSAAADASGFFAYHTKLNTGADFERYSRTDEHPDLVVQLAQPAGRLVFWRGSSYLPYWETTQGKFDLEQIVPRQGDGTATHPDRVNAFSRVWLVEEKPDQVTIRWRYLPVFQAGNPYGGVAYRNFVEETFVVTPAGQVVRTIKQGTAKLDNWNDPLNQTVVNLALTPSGVIEQSRTLPQHSPPAAGLSYPTKGPPVIAPVREWRFDEGSGDVTEETTNNISATIAGHKSLWRKGVSGTCLQFDGYHSQLSLPSAQAPALSDAVTLEAWVAVGAYPWNWCPIIQQGDDAGYFLGVGSHGEAAFKLMIGGVWQELVHAGPLPTFRWLHLTGTYDRTAGTMVLYLDGQAVAQRAVTAGTIQTTGDPLRIGMGMPRQPTDSQGGSVDLATYGFDGLIDEVRIYSQALSAAQVQSSFTNYRPAAGDLNSPPMDARPLPAFDTGGQFGAHYTRLKYHDVWDNLWQVGPSPDVVVGFDDLPGKFVFWRGAGYIPMLVNEQNQWYSNEFNETWGGAGWAGCREPMSDKESLYNHARIIENSPARVVVHWRYPLVDIRQNIANHSSSTGWGDWSDWYYTIYPDGTAVKRMRLWTAGTRNHEWHESMLIMASGQRPADLLESQSPLNHADLAGQTVSIANSKIQVVNLQAEYDPFTIGDFTGAGSFSGGLGWNHWPTSQIPNAGRNAPMPDRASHTSFNHLYLPDHGSSLGDAPYQEKIMLEGLSTRSATGLAPLARSWLQAPAIATLADCQGAAYVPAERAYHLTATGVAPSVRIAASAESPLVNLCLVVKEWTNPADAPARLLIDGVEQPAGANFRQGIVRNTNGNPMLVVWLRHQATAPVTFTLLAKPSTPTGLTATPGLAAVALKWALATGATGYKLWQRNTRSGVVRIDTVAAPFRMNTGLDIGTSYEFKVCATSSSGDSEWSGVVSATPTATKGSQTITFTLGPALAMAWNDPPFVDPAVASTGLAVTYSTDNPAVATVDAVTGMVTITGIGTAHLLANQAGDAAFLPAPQASQALTVGKAGQTITFDLGPALAKKRNDPPFANPATASSGLPVAYTSDNPNVATVDSETGMVTIVGAGTARLLANQAGDSNHHPAPQVAQTLTVRSVTAASSYGTTRIPFVNSGTLVGAAVFGNAGIWDGIPFSLWSPPFTTAKALGAGVSAVASASWNSTTSLGGVDQYATVAYTSGSAPGSLTISGLDAGHSYRIQYGFCDQRVGSYPYSVSAVLTLADASTTPVPLSIGATTTADDYALITATVTGSTSLRLDLPQAPNGVGPSIAGFAVHQIAPSGYNAWTAANAGGQSADIDHDGDGVPNGIEYFMGATGSTSTAIPPIMHTGGVITWTWPYDPAAPASYKFQLSVDLIDWTATVAPPDPNILILASPDRVRFTLPQGPLKRFCRLAVAPIP
jgi:hypothetical protein